MSSSTNAIPRFATTKIGHRDEDLGALDVVLDTGDMQEIESSFAKITLQGARSSEAVLGLIDDGSKLGSSSKGGHGVSPRRGEQKAPANRTTAGGL